MKRYKICLLNKLDNLELNTIYVKPRNGKIEYALKLPNGAVQVGLILESKLKFKIENSSDLNYLRHFGGAIAREVIKDILINQSDKRKLLIEPVKFFLNPFAVSGDRSAVPDGVQIDGSMSYEQGFTPPYGGDYPGDPSAIPIPRTQTNQYLYDITNALQQYQTEGFPDFITSADNGGSPYPYDAYAVVRYYDGTATQLYQSLISSNTDLPTVTTSWRLLSNGISASAAYCASVYSNIGLPAPSGTVKVPFNIVNFDDTGIFDAINSRLIPNQMGYHLINSFIGVIGDGLASGMSLSLYKNGSPFCFLDLEQINPTQEVALKGTKLVYANGSTDYFEIYTNTGGNTVFSVNNTQSYFEINFEGTQPLLLSKKK